MATKYCDRCDGWGSMDSCDPEEQAHGARDTCYKCEGTGRVPADTPNDYDDQEGV